MSARLGAILFTVSLVTAVGTCPAWGAAPTAARGEAVVASDHVLASGCGETVLVAGGNAADAAVATALCAGVVQPAGSGLGGGGFAVVMLPGMEAATVLDFREVAPASATAEMYVGPDGEVVKDLSRKGGLAVAVPAESRGLATLHARYGVLPSGVVARPAVRLAARGFEVGEHLAGALAKSKDAEILAAFRVDDGVAQWRDVVRRPALARTLKRWARTQGEDLHTGVSAAAVVEAARRTGGVLTAADLAGLTVKERAPIVTNFLTYTVYTMPPPSSGGVALAQVLTALDGDVLEGVERGTSDYLHLLTETMKHAYADRAHHLGDPDFVDVPVHDLLSAERAAEIRAAFDVDQTLPPEAYGPLIAPPRDAGTQHISVRDAAGGAVALTTTINTSFGSGVVSQGAGVVLNNEMDDFVAKPGVPNAYGLVGGTANAIAPGKRPLSSMTPTIVTNGEGEVVLVVGASGGSTIISSTLQVLLDVLVFGVDPAEAVAAPRIHHQWQPDVLFMEPDHAPEVREAMVARGHDVTVRRAFSAVQVVYWAEGLASGGSDPRKHGVPATVPLP